MDILSFLPQQAPFRFFDEVIEVEEEKIIGAYTFRKDEYFYAGHFPSQAITPGVILIECMAQIGLLGLGIYHMIQAGGNELPPFAFSSSEVDFLNPVYPGERVRVSAEKVYFRLGKLKVKAQMVKADGDIAAQGQLAGIMRWKR